MSDNDEVNDDNDMNDNENDDITCWLLLFKLGHIRTTEGEIYF